MRGCALSIHPGITCEKRSIHTNMVYSMERHHPSCTTRWARSRSIYIASCACAGAQHFPSVPGFPYTLASLVKNVAYIPVWCIPWKDTAPAVRLGGLAPARSSSDITARARVRSTFRGFRAFHTPWYRL